MTSVDATVTLSRSHQESGDGTWGMKLTRAETSRVRDYAAALGMCAIFTNKLPKVAIACAVFGSYIVAQANIAQGDSPKTCLFFTAAPVPGVIWRLPC